MEPSFGYMARLRERPFAGPRNLISHPLQEPNFSFSGVLGLNEQSVRAQKLTHAHTGTRKTHNTQCTRTYMWTPPINAVRITNQCFVLYLLSYELIFTERVAGFSCDGIYRPFLHLLLYSTIEHKQRLSSTLLQRRAETERNRRSRY